MPRRRISPCKQGRDRTRKVQENARAQAPKARTTLYCVDGPIQSIRFGSRRTPVRRPATPPGVSPQRVRKKPQPPRPMDAPVRPDARLNGTGLNGTRLKGTRLKGTGDAVTWRLLLTSSITSPPTSDHLAHSMGVCRTLGFPGHSARLNVGHACVLDGYGGRSIVSAGRPMSGSMSMRSQLSFEAPCWLD